ncbi:MAG: 6-carboxytetrahydropterin synthase QueD [Candidatus Omnitrophica bacterium]|nr:6-carboxytetrahydropterin synthase QueD [Candidatus Omnitrophota bacterium]
MYSLKVEGVFSSAHNLRGYKGKCEDLHGHNWRVEICVQSKTLDNIGMVLDFKYLKKKLNTVLEKMDHKYLNKLIPFKKLNPTSENIAKHIYNELKVHIPLLKNVTVWENSSSSATYEE